MYFVEIRTSTNGNMQWGGVPPLIILFCLCIFSLEPIRSRYYEAFYQTHILLAITYFGLLYWHAGNVLDSWIYLYATMALWLASWLARAFWYTQPLNIHNSWFEGSPTTLKKLSGDMTRIEVLAPLGFKYSPSQHCFLRAPKIALLDNHPFTICSSCITPTSEEKKLGIEYQQSLVFLIRTHAGFTKKLARYVTSHPDNQLKTWIEGPYGGIRRHIELAYDNLVLVAGGGGISACLPWLSFLRQKIREGNIGDLRIRRVAFLWTVKDTDHFSWVKDVLETDLAALSENLSITTTFHVTKNSSESLAAGDKEKVVTSLDKVAESNADEIRTPSEECSHSSRSLDPFGSPTYGRPVMCEFLDRLNLEGRSFIIGCGPDNLRSDLANACADKQWDVFNGKSEEIALHLEAFGW